MLHRLFKNASPLEYCIPLGQLAAICSSVLVIRRIFAHAAHFRVPACQRKIIGILWIVPIYSVHSIFTFSDAKGQLIADLIRDSYEAFVLYMFFSLTICILCEGEGGLIDAYYLQRLLADIQKSPQWLLYIKRCILQYAAVRVAMTFLGIVLTFIGVYETRLDLYGPFLYMTTILFMSCSVALYYLAMWYSFVQHDMQFAPHLLIVKFAGIKTIISLSFLESVIVSLFMQQYVNIDTKIPIELQNILQLEEATISRGDKDFVTARVSHLLMSFTIPLFAAVLLWGYPVSPYLDETHPRGTLLSINWRQHNSMAADGTETTSAPRLVSRVSRAPHTSEYFGFRDTFSDVKLLFREPRSDFSIYGHHAAPPAGNMPQSQISPPRVGGFSTNIIQSPSQTGVGGAREAMSSDDFQRICAIPQVDLMRVSTELGVIRRSHEYLRLSTGTPASGRSLIPSDISNPERQSLLAEDLQEPLPPPRSSLRSQSTASRTSLPI